VIAGASSTRQREGLEWLIRDQIGPTAIPAMSAKPPKAEAISYLAATP
jgi:hypothetical protein